jgi:S-adenosylmethionine-diacylglycerol 3-amino-3-carboxypropyl transferase
MLNRVNAALFNWIHQNNLVYNTCWEDPRLDRTALALRPSDRVMVITSAGCNALDYALAGAQAVHAVDMNPRQNALLELKLAGLRTLKYEQFFDVFGKGWSPYFPEFYWRHMRPALPEIYRQFWDRRTGVFAPPSRRGGLYFHGTSGLFARAMNVYLDRRPRLRASMDAILSAPSLEAQQEIYFSELRDLFWNRFMRWCANRDTVLAMVGVPRAQRRQVESFFSGGIAQFVEHCLEGVFATLPLSDNYFWRVYLTGRYTEDCCPEYLKRENFEALQGGVVDHVITHTGTVEGFLRGHEEPISRFVLLDHMDWMAGNNLTGALQAEWQAIVDRATPDARLIWRSGGLRVDYVDPLLVEHSGETVQLGEVLRYQKGLAAELHKHDRVHTYGSFYIADLPGMAVPA